MAKKSASPNMVFAVAQLRKNPKMSFATLRSAAEKRGLTVVPIVYGRAKLALGLSKPAADPVSGPVEGRRDKAPVAKAPVPGPIAPGPVPPVEQDGVGPKKRRIRPIRPSDDISAGPAIDLKQLVEVVRQAEAQRKALEKIYTILTDLGIGSAGSAPRKKRGRPRKPGNETP